VAKTLISVRIDGLLPCGQLRRAHVQPMLGIASVIPAIYRLHPHHVEYGFPDPTRVEIRRSVHGKLAWRY
jgi:hypothetical protein